MTNIALARIQILIGVVPSMKRRNGLPIYIISVVLFSACATTHYTPLASADKDQVEQIKEHIYRVEYQVSPFTSQEQLDEYLRRRVLNSRCVKDMTYSNLLSGRMCWGCHVEHR